MPSCALYCRVSTDTQRERHTIDSQRVLLPKLAAQHGLTVYKEYIDDGISGESIEARPAFRQLLDDASAGAFQAVLVIDFDRLTRATDLTQLALIKRIFRDAGVIVITPGQVFDFKNEDQDFLSDLFGILAKHEKRKILARTRRGMLEKKRQGKWIMGVLPTPYYRAPDRSIRIDPKKKAQVIAILKAARRHGVPTLSRRFGLYQGQARRILSPRRLLFYAGFMELEGRRVRGEWPPIIKPAEIEALQARVAARRDRREYQTSTYLLTGLGLFRCGRCGRAVGSHTVTSWRRDKQRMGEPPRKYRCRFYRCNNRQCPLHGAGGPRADRIDAIVLGRLDHQIRRLVLIRKFMAAYQARQKHSGELAAIEQKILEETRRRRNLVTAIGDGVVRLSEAAEEMETIRTALEKLDQSREAIMGRDAGRIAPQDLAGLKALRIQTLSQTDQRRILTICLAELTLQPKNLWIHYRFPIRKDGEAVERVRLARP